MLDGCYKIDGEGVRHTELSLYPCTIGVLADLVDLEPFRCGGVELIAGRRAAGGQVGEQRAGVMWPLRRQHVYYHIAKVSSEIRTLVSPSDHRTSILLPGLALAIKADGTALKPQLVSGLVAPFTGLMSLIWRMTLWTLEGGSLGGCPLKSLPSMDTDAT
jgi:hypothetical protein